MSAELDPHKLRDGDPATVAAFQAILAKRLRRWFHDQTKVESLVNTALLELLEKFDRGDRPAVPLYWALTAADNTARREFTRRRRKVVAYESGLHGSASNDHQAIAEAREELARVNELLAEVDERQIQILAAAARGLSYREIAAELGTTLSIVRTALWRLRTELQKQLSAQERLDDIRRLVRESGLSAYLPARLRWGTAESSSSSSPA